MCPGLGLTSQMSGAIQETGLFGKCCVPHLDESLRPQLAPDQVPRRSNGLGLSLETEGKPLMRDRIRGWARALAWGVAVLLLAQIAALPAAAEVRAWLFWHEGCPHCEGARAALADIAEAAPDLVLTEVELGESAEGDTLFDWANAQFGNATSAVPFFIVGEAATVGYSDGLGTADTYRAMIADCRATGCADVLSARAPVKVPGMVAAGEVTLPLIGTVTLADLSLPALTLVLAAVDGFNPCAMWVLAILIGFLLGVEDRRRMWVLGLVFLGATGVMYLAIMAAWLNVVLWLGALAWLRLAVGVAALTAGGYYLKSWWTDPVGVCKVTSPGRRRSITERFRAVVAQPSLLLAALGIAALAVGVNLIELVCSAGIPAVYTQALAMHDLPAAGHYAYLLLYIAVFLLDDTAIFVTAMLTLRFVASAGSYARLSHLVGGVVLIGLGAVMILRPDLLA